MTQYDKFTEEFDSLIIQGIQTGMYIQPMDLNDQTNIIVDLGYDSILIIQLIVDIENTFGIEFPDELLLLEKIQQYSKLKELVYSIICGKDESR